MTDQEAFKEFAKGVTFTIGLAGVSFLLVAIFGTVDPQPVANPDNTNSNFTVVDTYKGCDVVRWALPSHAEYKYFLHCEK
jgi:hypothetical protein